MRLDFGKVEYSVADGREDMAGAHVLKLKLLLTLIGQDDDRAMREGGLAELRRKRILRLAREAESQGNMLNYDDLCSLLFCSLATIKRDLKAIESEGHRVPLKGRRRNGNAAVI